MSEYVRSVEIVVEIDTNKTTYRETFASMEEAEAFYQQIADSLG